MNLTPIMTTVVASGIGYLINGADGAVWGAVIMGSITVVATVIFGLTD